VKTEVCNAAKNYTFPVPTQLCWGATQEIACHLCDVLSYTQDIWVKTDMFKSGYQKKVWECHYHVFAPHYTPGRINFDGSSSNVTFVQFYFGMFLASCGSSAFWQRCAVLFHGGS